MERAARALRGSALALILAAAPPVWADRPLETEDTGTLDPGAVEIELGGEYARNPEDRTWTAVGVLNLGLLRRLEAKLAVPLLLREPDTASANGGAGDIALGAKYRVLDESAVMPALLGQVTLRLPTGDTRRGLGEEDVDVEVLAALGKSLGAVTLTWNGGYTFVTRDRELDAWLLRAALEYAATSAWSLVGEVVSTRLDAGSAATAVLRAGTTYAISKRVRFDTAVGAGVTRSSPDVLVTIGLTLGPF